MFLSLAMHKLQGHLLKQVYINGPATIKDGTYKGNIHINGDVKVINPSIQEKMYVKGNIPLTWE